MSTATAENIVELPRTITIPNDGLRQLANVALFASDDQTLPSLCAVHLVSDGKVLRVEATDRYQAARERIELSYLGDEPQDGFDVLVDVAGIRDAVKIKAKAKYDSLPVTITVNHQTVTFDNGEAIARARIVGLYGNDSWVRLDPFFQPVGPFQAPDYEQPLVIGFNPQYLAKLAKVRPENGKPPTVLRWTIGNPMKPTRVEIGDTFIAVFMPVRVSS